MTLNNFCANLNMLLDKLRLSKQQYGLVTEWLGSGLQNRLRRFKSDPGLMDSIKYIVLSIKRLILNTIYLILLARVAELVYATDLKSVSRKGLWVRVPLRAHSQPITYNLRRYQ